MLRFVLRKALWEAGEVTSWFLSPFHHQIRRAWRKRLLINEYVMNVSLYIKDALIFIFSLEVRKCTQSVFGKHLKLDTRDEGANRLTYWKSVVRYLNLLSPVILPLAMSFQSTLMLSTFSTMGWRKKVGYCVAIMACIILRNSHLIYVVQYCKRISCKICAMEIRKTLFGSVINISLCGKWISISYPKGAKIQGEMVTYSSCNYVSIGSFRGKPAQNTYP